MSGTNTDIPDEHEQEAAVEAFFESLDDDPNPLEAGAEAIEEALKPDEEPEGDEDQSEAPEEPEGPSEGDEDEESEEEDDNEDSVDDTDPVEKRFRNLQSLHDRQMNEMRERMTELQTWAQNSYQHQVAQHQQLVAGQQAAQQQAQQANPLANVTPEILKQGIETDLATTFRQIATHRPDLMARTIAEAREVYGNETGDSMQLEYNNHLLQQQNAAQEARWAQQEQQRQVEQQPQQIEATMTTLVDDIAAQYGEAFEPLREDFIKRASDAAPAFREYMDGRGLEMTPDAINYFLQKCVNDVREERIMAQASKPRKARKVAPSEHVETSTSGDGSREEDMTADERAINELLEGAAELSIDTTRPTR